jgi:transposase InsO family protein
MVARVLAVRDQFDTWGGRKIRKVLLNEGHRGVPVPSTITEILRREGRLNQPVRSQREYIRFRAPHPNDLWQMDFKGDFSLTSGGRCYTLTVIDDHSRYLTGLQACPNQQRITVKTALTTVFRTVGLPVTIICDHGPPWGHDTTQPYTRLGAWLLSLGVDIIHGRPFHPQTRGKGERVHRTMGEDVLDGVDWDTVSTVQDALDDWLGIYNHYRPHQALDLDTPADHYHPSVRAFPEVIAVPDYPRPREVRIVQANGYISWTGSRLKVGKAFSGEPVQVTLHPDETITITYYQTIIKTHPGPVTHDPEHL